jgi:serine/threonine-protein kinase
MATETPKYRRFGPYVLLQRTGAGGMGRVDVALSARAQGMQRLCVVKRIQAHLRSEEQEARFRREAGIAIGLSHGAIAQTLDVEEIDGELCILQEYIHGTTLAYLENRAASHQPLPIALSVHVVHEVARALAYAHSLPGPGIVHRDVTPDNIMLSFTGEVKLIDFGIAKVVGDSSLTQARMVVGRPIYTAPEALAGGEADHRSDLYSLGVVLWILLTGRYFPDIFEQGAAPAPSTFNPAVSPQLDSLCLKAIAVRAEDRWRSADELLDAIVLLPGASQMHDRKVAAFLAKHFEVEEERRQLARDIAEARELLEDESSAPTPSIPTAAVESSSPEAPALVRVASFPRPVFGKTLSWGLALGAGAAAMVSWAVWPAARVVSTALICPPIAVAPPPVAASAPSPEPSPSLPLVPEPPKPPLVATSPSATAAGPDKRRLRTAPARKALPPAGSSDGDGAGTLLRDATAQLKAGAFDRAFALANSAAQRGAGAPAHLIMGKVFFAKSDLSRAEAEFRAVAASRPDDPEAAQFLEVIRKESHRAP